MKKKSSVSLGPGASSLILIFVVLSLAVLGMLSLMTSRNDMRLSERNVQVTEAIYVLNARAERRYAELDAIVARCAQDNNKEQLFRASVRDALPEDVTMENGLLLFWEEDDSRTLDCALRLNSRKSASRLEWVRYDLTAETGDDLWN